LIPKPRLPKNGKNSDDNEGADDDNGGEDDDIYVYFNAKHPIS